MRRLQKIFGLVIILMGIYLEYLWLGLCFEVIIIGILLLIFAARILFFPFNFFLIVGLTILAGGRLNRENFKYQYDYSSHNKGFSGFHMPPTLDHYYEVLESKEDDDMSVIKKNYRRLMKQYHYDTLASQNLSESEMEIAQKKSQEINEAYESIKKARG